MEGYIPPFMVKKKKIVGTEQMFMLRFVQIMLRKRIDHERNINISKVLDFSPRKVHKHTISVVT